MEDRYEALYLWTHERQWKQHTLEKRENLKKSAGKTVSTWKIMKLGPFPQITLM